MAIVRKIISWENPVVSGAALAVLNLFFAVTWYWDMSLIYNTTSLMIVSIAAIAIAQKFSNVEDLMQTVLVSNMDEDNVKDVYQFLYKEINCCMNWLRSVMLVKCAWRTFGTLIATILIASFTSCLSHFMCLWLLSNLAFIVPVVKVTDQQKEKAKELFEKINAQLEDVLSKVPNYNQIERQEKYKPEK